MPHSLLPSPGLPANNATLPRQNTHTFCLSSDVDSQTLSFSSSLDKEIKYLWFNIVQEYPVIQDIRPTPFEFGNGRNSGPYRKHGSPTQEEWNSGNCSHKRHATEIHNLFKIQRRNIKHQQGRRQLLNEDFRHKEDNNFRKEKRAQWLSD